MTHMVCGLYCMRCDSLDGLDCDVISNRQQDVFETGSLREWLTICQVGNLSYILYFCSSADFFLN